MKKIVILVIILLFPISTYAEYGKGVFDQTKAFPACISVLNEFGTIKYYTPKQACNLLMAGYNIENGILKAVAYSTYGQIISVNKGVVRVQFKDRYSIPSTYDFMASGYSFSKDDIGSTVVLNIMYNNNLDRGDYVIINEVPYQVTVAQFVTLDLSNMNKYCEITYGKGYKYHLLTHSCKK